MDFGHRSSNEIGNGDLLHNGDPRIRKVLNGTCEDPEQPQLPVVSARAHREQAIADFGKKAAGEAFEPSGERIRAPLTAGFPQSTAGQTTSLSKALPQTRTLATGKSARIAIKARGRIPFIDVADVIAVEAKGKLCLVIAYFKFAPAARIYLDHGGKTQSARVCANSSICAGERGIG
jgi:hypothetical protein